MARHRTLQEKLDLAQLYLGGNLSMRKFSAKYGVSTSLLQGYIKLFENQYDSKIIEMRNLDTDTDTDTDTMIIEYNEMEEWCMVKKTEILELCILMEKKRFKHKTLQRDWNSEIQHWRDKL